MCFTTQESPRQTAKKESLSLFADELVKCAMTVNCYGIGSLSGMASHILSDIDFKPINSLLGKYAEAQTAYSLIESPDIKRCKDALSGMCNNEILKKYNQYPESKLLLSYYFYLLSNKIINFDERFVIEEDYEICHKFGLAFLKEIDEALKCDKQLKTPTLKYQHEVENALKKIKEKSDDFKKSKSPDKENGLKDRNGNV